jgi:hypothetical protein
MSFMLVLLVVGEPNVAREATNVKVRPGVGAQGLAPLRLFLEDSFADRSVKCLEFPP